MVRRTLTYGTLNRGRTLDGGTLVGRLLLLPWRPGRCIGGRGPARGKIGHLRELARFGLDRGCDRASGHHVRHVESPLQPIEAGMDASTVVVRGWQQDAGADQLQMQSGCGGAAHLHQAGRDHLRRPGEFSGTQCRGLGPQPFGLVIGHVDQPGSDRVGHLGNDDQVARPFEQVLGEAPRVLADLDHLVDRRKDPLAVACGESIDDLVQ